MKKVRFALFAVALVAICSAFATVKPSEKRAVKTWRVLSRVVHTTSPLVYKVYIGTEAAPSSSCINPQTAFCKLSIDKDLFPPTTDGTGDYYLSNNTNIQSLTDGTYDE